MEQGGQFRTGLYGFRKQDVLLYLEQVNNRYFEEQQQLRQELSESRTEADSLRQQLAESRADTVQAQEDTVTLQNAIDEYVQSARERRAETEELLQLRREKQMWRVKESTLSRAAGEATRLQKEVETLTQQLGDRQETPALQQQLETLRRENESYRQLLAALSGLMTQLHQMEQETLQDGHEKSETALKIVYGLLEEWENRTAENKKQVLTLQQELKARHGKTDQRLEELMKELETAARMYHP